MAVKGVVPRIPCGTAWGMLQTLVAFSGAAVVVALVPGPSMAVIVRQSVTAGRRAGVAAMLGNETGVVLWGLAAARTGLRGSAGGCGPASGHGVPVAPHWNPPSYPQHRPQLCRRNDHLCRNGGVVSPKLSTGGVETVGNAQVSPSVGIGTTGARVFAKVTRGADTGVARPARSGQCPPRTSERLRSRPCLVHASAPAQRRPPPSRGRAAAHVFGFSGSAVSSGAPSSG
jgi:hypothetical protein